MDDLIERIRERVADPLRAVEAAAWVRPMPTIAAPATPGEVDAAEAALGFAIPPLLRRLYTEVGNGGFGPVHGLEGVPSTSADPHSANIVLLYQAYSTPDPDYPAHAWPDGFVPLIDHGCLILECADFRNPPYRVALFDGGKTDFERPVLDSLRPVADSLEDRLEAWLAG
ncbi:MAG: SMI1/KNR4 family protein [Isosphaeraceae bacterium]